MRVTIDEVRRIVESDEDEALITETLREVFKYDENDDTFSLFFFPHAVTDSIPEFHRDIYLILSSSSNDYFAAPRGHAKTTIVSIKTIKQVCYRTEPYIVFTGQNHHKTVQFLDPIRHELRNNKLLHWVYGEFRIGKATDEQGKEREDCIDVNGIRIEAASFEKNMRGFKYRNMRPTLIYLDDIEDDQRVLNPELRLKDEAKLNRVIIPSLDVNGRLKMVGTILHPDSLLMKKITQHKGKIWKACDQNFENILWPVRWTKERLEDMQRNIGPVAFDQEFRNNPTDSSASLIKGEWVDWCRREDLSEEDMQHMTFKGRFLGEDFAFEDRVTSNQAAWYGIGVKDGYEYIIHQEVAKGLSAHEQLSHTAYSLQPKFKFDLIGLEENSIKAVSKDLRQYDCPFVLFWTGASDEASKKVGTNVEFFGKRHTVGKLQMLNRIGTKFFNKKYVIPYKTEKDKRNFQALRAELTSYALHNGELVEAGVHPDRPMALGFASECVERFKGRNIEIRFA